MLSWGNGANGRLGLGDTRDKVAATRVDKLQGTDIVRVFCGVSHSLAVSATGVAYSWGKNSSGQCGHADSIVSDQVGAGSLALPASFALAKCKEWRQTERVESIATRSTDVKFPCGNENASKI